MIVEFCKYGSLRDYLIKKRDEFIDTMDDGKKRMFMRKQKEAAANGEVGGASNAPALNYVNLKSDNDDEEQ